MKKQNILIELTKTLQRLTFLLSLDPSSIWTETFRRSSEIAEKMLDAPLDFAQLAQLSASIRHVFGGVGSFNDYEPMRFNPASGRYIPIEGAEDFDALRRKVYELSIALIEQ
jgi:hypothetical protein